MKTFKYMRIQGRETAYRTQKPVGVFILNWRRIRDGVYSKEDADIYDRTHKWFLKNLPVPPFYGNDNENPDGAVTWFKTEKADVMLEHIMPLLELLEKYGIPYDVVYTDTPGKIVYEDDFQVGTVD